jgi:hypothetical protein
MRDLGYISRFCAPVHLLAIYERGIRHDGATIIEGLPKATLLSAKRACVVRTDTEPDRLAPLGPASACWPSAAALAS